MEQASVAPGAEGFLPTTVPSVSEDTTTVANAPGDPLGTAPEPAGLPTGGQPGSGMGGDLPPELLPNPAYPQCPVTELGNWWTDPADPYTCLPPASRGFSEPVPPVGPGDWTPWDPAPAGPVEDCRLDGAQRCEVLIMGQAYVVTFSEGVPLHVYAAPAG